MSKNQFYDYLDTAVWVVGNIIIWGCIGVMLAWRG